MPSLVDVLSRQTLCYGDCHATLTHEQRRRAVEAIYHCDDALRGWGYVPIYDRDGDQRWREAQSRNDSAYRGVAVRFGECIYRRLVGSMLHEVLHGLFGDSSKANYGIPFGLPYGVPETVPERDEEAYLAPHNFAEACAFVGVQLLATTRFAIDWPALNAREWGTFCFKGGNALVHVPAGYRAVAHLDPVHHRDRYLRRARTLEDDAKAHLTHARIAELVAHFDAAAGVGRGKRPVRFPAPEAIARLLPVKLGPNDLCPCESGKKVKRCCGVARPSIEDAPPYTR